jgi:hypothetical protein
MACSASAVDGDGRVLCILLTARQKSITKFKTVWGRDVSASPPSHWEGEAERLRRVLRKSPETGSTPVALSNSSRRPLGCSCCPARFIPIGALTVWTAFRFGFGIAGKPFILAGPAFPKPNRLFYSRHVGMLSQIICSVKEYIYLDLLCYLR